MPPNSFYFLIGEITMKQMQITEAKIGDNTFYIKPFPAFTAAKISGDLSALLMPVVGGVAAAIPGNSGDTDKDVGEITSIEDVTASIMDMDIDTALPAMSKEFAGISGDKIEALMKKLFITHNNVSFEGEITNGDVKPLTYDLANEVFCGDVQDMYILCYHVIKVNFKGFFKKIGNLFGSRKKSTEETAEKTTSDIMAPLM